MVWCVCSGGPHYAQLNNASFLAFFFLSVKRNPNLGLIAMSQDTTRCMAVLALNNGDDDDAFSVEIGDVRLVGVRS